MIKLIKVFDIFSSFSDLKLHKSKCEVAGIGALKVAKLALSGMKCTDLRLNTVKILGIHFLYNKKIESDAKFDIKRNNDCFQSVTMSKIVYLALITKIPTLTFKRNTKIIYLEQQKSKNKKSYFT